MSLGRAGLPVLLLTLLSACGTLAPSGPASDASTDLVSYYRYAAALDRTTLAHEYANFQDWTTDSGCTADRIRLAILGMQMARRGEENAQPAQVLTPCLDGPARPAPALRHMAYLLQDQWASRARLRQRATRLEAELAEANELRQALARRKGELENQVDALQEQLEALKDIERSIRRRN